ncbi:iron hydrogenase, partial [Pelagophyceae sp. CCMP2097]
GDGRLPLVTSACPGVVCFIEKSCPKVLPHVSSARSPMSALGALIKQRDGAVLPAGAWDKPVAHVAVMPCADKKLEAARRDFLDDG